MFTIYLGPLTPLLCCYRYAKMIKEYKYLYQLPFPTEITRNHYLLFMTTTDILWNLADDIRVIMNEYFENMAYPGLSRMFNHPCYKRNNRKRLVIYLYLKNI